jgi:hypothetical protein
MANRKKKKCKCIRNFFVIALLVFVTARIYYRATDDFRISNITYDIPHNADWELPPLSADDRREVAEIFDQSFTYIGKGAQSYAFVSDDNDYVIKFFKYKHLKPSWFVQNLPDIGPLKAYRERVKARKQHKLNCVFNGYHLAYEVHKKECGLIFVHLNRGNDLNKKVILVDKIGIRREVDLDTVNFVLQERVDTSRKAIFSALAGDHVDKANRYIHHLIDLYLSEYSKGIYDHDHGVLHNTGFVGERPVHLDVGKLYRDENIHKPEYAQQDLAFIVAKISNKIYMRYPNYHPQIADSMASYLKEAFDQPSQHLLECCYRH